MRSLYSRLVENGQRKFEIGKTKRRPSRRYEQGFDLENSPVEVDSRLHVGDVMNDEGIFTSRASSLQYGFSKSDDEYGEI